MPDRVTVYQPFVATSRRRIKKQRRLALRSVFLDRREAVARFGLFADVQVAALLRAEVSPQHVIPMSGAEYRVIGCSHLDADAVEFMSDDDVLVARTEFLLTQPEWNAGTWFIDPVRKPPLVDVATGRSPQDPVRTFAELTKRWGTDTPVIPEKMEIKFVGRPPRRR